jgi:hypothetical protein
MTNKIGEIANKTIIVNAEAYLNTLGKDGCGHKVGDFQTDPTMPGRPTHFHGIAKRSQ